MVKEAELVFTVPVIMQFWRLRENELLIIDLFLPVVSSRNWRGDWSIKGIDWVYGTAGAFHLDRKRYWGKSGPVMGLQRIYVELQMLGVRVFHCSSILGARC